VNLILIFKGQSDIYDSCEAFKLRYVLLLTNFFPNDEHTMREVRGSLKGGRGREQ
jgi:hypothetical protein